MAEEDLHTFIYWLAMRIVCALFGHVYRQSEILEDGSAIVFECELCARCDTPNHVTLDTQGQSSILLSPPRLSGAR
jgi:hypothetical protein